MKQAHVFISGTVQGVGYRYFVKQNAKQLGLTGWVRNTEDGGVEAVLQGDETSILELIERCNEGPPKGRGSPLGGPFMAEVKHIGFEWEDVEDNYFDFAIR